MTAVRQSNVRADIDCAAELDEWFASSPEAVLQAVQRLEQVLADQQVRFSDGPLPVTIKPVCIATEEERRRARASEAALEGLVELAELAARDDDVLGAIGFDRPARDLLRLEPRASVTPAFARGDALVTSAGLRLVEMNTDSPGMGVYPDVLQAAVLAVLREAGLRFVERCRQHVRIQRMHGALLGRYRAAGGDRPDPMIAIVDWSGVKTADEQRRQARELAALGCRSELFAPGELAYRDGRLTGRGLEIDIVHRRVLFPELVARPDESRALVRAVGDGAVVMVNPLASYVAGNKGLLALAHDDAFARRLPTVHREALRRSIPYSLLVDDAARRMLATAPRSEWVIKSSFGSGGTGVVLGAAVTNERWQAAITATRTGCWIAQRAVEIPMIDLPVIEGTRCTRQPFWTNWNPWLIDGTYAGAIARCSRAPVISISARGALAACYSLW